MKKSAVFLLIIFFIIPVANAKNYYAAIAINLEKGIVSSAPDYASSQDVQKIVMASCQKKSGGKPCVLAIAFSDSCGAVAWSPTKKVGGGGWGESSLQQAKNEALSRCTSKGARDCRVLDSFCTSWETEEVIWW